jgi:N-acetyl-1-D-myo-inositol-2-amino-2-deoxy-alpha-D-glucopyranoside deacetylase
MTDSRTLLLVHAHPDDEAIPTGATMALYARDGARVHLVTCTRGERGEVVDESLAHLRGDPEALAERRVAELADALTELGGAGHDWLGGAGRWWDSGMVGTPDNDDPRAFHRADPAETTRAMVEIVRRVRPDVLVAYDENGGYGHPDHIQAHRVAMAALDPAADPGYAPELGEPWSVRKVYWSVIPKETVARLAEDAGFTISDEMPGVSDDMITAQVDGREFVPAKVAALRAHHSQVDLTNGFFSRFAHRPEFGLEHYQLVRGARGRSGPGEQGWEDDLFA